MIYIIYQSTYYITIKFQSVQSKAEAVHYSMSALAFAAGISVGVQGKNRRQHAMYNICYVDILQNVLKMAG